jgi:hypothetical protein
MKRTSRKNFGQFMRNLLNLLMPLTIQTNFRFRCYPEIVIHNQEFEFKKITTFVLLAFIYLHKKYHNLF